MREDRGFLGIMSCKSGEAFTDVVVEHMKSLYRELGSEKRFRPIDTNEIWFANGEVKTVINEPIRGGDIYIIQLMQF